MTTARIDRILIAGLGLLWACGDRHDAAGSADVDGTASDAASSSATESSTTTDDPSAGPTGDPDDGESDGTSSGESGGDDGAVPDDAPFLLYDGEGGVTRQYFNVEASLAWRNEFGDWRDADGVEQGEVPIATVDVADQDTAQTVEIDLGPGLVDGADWLWQGVLLRVPAGGNGGIAVFHSREASDPTLHPRLVLADAEGTMVEVAPAADVHVDGSTSGGLGTSATWRVSADNNAMLRFEPPDPPIVPTSAKLVLTTTDTQYGAATVGVYSLVARRPEYLPKTTGLAADFPLDDGIAAHPDVFMATRFDGTDWCEGFTGCNGSANDSVRLTTDAEAAEEGFDPLDGTALRVHYFPGGLSATSQQYNFLTAGDGEQEEVYFRYYLRFGLDFVPIVDGGKMPGIATDDSYCGSGGSPSDGKCGWSLRGSFKIAMSPDNPLYPRQVVGTYAYHGKMTGDYGDPWRWQQYGLAAIELGQWSASSST